MRGGAEQGEGARPRKVLHVTKTSEVFPKKAHFPRAPLLSRARHGG